MKNKPIRKHQKLLHMQIRLNLWIGNYLTSIILLMINKFKIYAIKDIDIIKINQYHILNPYLKIYRKLIIIMMLNLLNKVYKMEYLDSLKSNLMYIINILLHI